ncbi:response regulator transcription factor [Bacillus sp. B-jedd]|uniref:response regulator transcription factor n=1 Tax=Bacillus sp. B-jedd TaxID=1476857 RepID=UPI0006624B93|nr:response regulator transcription factor [Bacillus sp. B-jedd]
MGNDGRYRVMIVDDEMLIRQGIKHYIDWEKEGFEIVAEAGNGREALDLMEGAKPHIILTDIVMPIMDGEELTKFAKKRNPDIEVIILSSFGDFDYVRSTFQHGVVDYILKPELDGPVLIEVLRKAAGRIESSGKMKKQPDGKLSIGDVISKVFSGYKVDQDDPALSFLLPFNGYCLAAFKKGDGGEFSSETVQKLEESLKSALGSSIISRIPGSHGAVNFFINTNHDWKAIVDSVNSATKNSTATNNNQVAAPQSTNSAPVYAAVGNYFIDLVTQGGAHREELDRLLSLHFYFPELVVLTPEILERTVPEPPEFNMDVFTAELRKREFAPAFMFLNQHAAVLRECFATDIFEFKAFFSNTIFNTAIILSNMGCEVKGLDQAKYQYLKLIDQAPTADHVLGLLDRFLEVVSKSLGTAPQAASSNNIKSIRQYIIGHYQEPLTLTNVAAHFHFNPSYLSSLFSAHNNESFTEYLNKVRIEEAVKLLAVGNEQISEISEKVGYSDHSYFCKVFKKIKGVSPSQYKRKYLAR